MESRSDGLAAGHRKMPVSHQSLQQPKNRVEDDARLLTTGVCHGIWCERLDWSDWGCQKERHLDFTVSICTVSCQFWNTRTGQPTTRLSWVTVKFWKFFWWVALSLWPIFSRKVLLYRLGRMILSHIKSSNIGHTVSAQCMNRTTLNHPVISWRPNTTGHQLFGSAFYFNICKVVILCYCPCTTLSIPLFLHKKTFALEPWWQQKASAVIHTWNNNDSHYTTVVCIPECFNQVQKLGITSYYSCNEIRGFIIGPFHSARLPTI